MHDFTVKDVVREVRRLAEEKPDFVYAEQEGYGTDSPACYYASADGRGNGAGCIVGQALGRLGVSQKDLEGLDDAEDSSVEAALQAVIPTTLDDEGMLDWLGLVQHDQDRGHEWGKAVAYADVLVGVPYGSN